ncbi:hypothetical protein D2T33_16195 [Sinirhodobacter populi]|uniref:Uncharacterized protein n=1 Tax=Paenirhodobacter populi TaxID=2306993 RepID=A0A443IP59_9RHOB|nr:hypothetical protein D2T33_16195 [Sinirhodobacter populi]
MIRRFCIPDAEPLQFRSPTKPQSRAAEQDDLLRPRLDMIDPRHELVKLAALIDRAFCARNGAGFFPRRRAVRRYRRADVSAAYVQPVETTADGLAATQSLHDARWLFDRGLIQRLLRSPTA